jgi:ribosome-binding protein aMBF1 (putative translation factor)
MKGNCGMVNNKLARKIVHEHNVFMKYARARMDETRRVTMISLKKLLKLKDGDVIEIKEDDTLQIIPAEEMANG